MTRVLINPYQASKVNHVSKVNEKVHIAETHGIEEFCISFFDMVIVPPLNKTSATITEPLIYMTSLLPDTQLHNNVKLMNTHANKAEVEEFVALIGSLVTQKIKLKPSPVIYQISYVAKLSAHNYSPNVWSGRAAFSNPAAMKGIEFCGCCREASIENSSSYPKFHICKLYDSSSMVTCYL